MIIVCEQVATMQVGRSKPSCILARIKSCTSNILLQPFYIASKLSTCTSRFHEVPVGRMNCTSPIIFCGQVKLAKVSHLVVLQEPNFIHIEFCYSHFVLWLSFIRHQLYDNIRPTGQWKQLQKDKTACLANNDLRCTYRISLYECRNIDIEPLLDNKAQGLISRLHLNRIY